MTYQPGRIEQSESPGRANRAEVSLTCEIRQGTRPWLKLKLQDISESGFCMDWRPGLTEHLSLYIRIPGLELLVANLRWKREGMIGCEFSHRLYPPVYDHIVRQSLLER